MKLLETDTVFAFMDIGPIARGHCLVIPKRESASELESASE
jgi:diadenosine tetraphosphate (Ap4A) HIT family hydrolase